MGTGEDAAVEIKGELTIHGTFFPLTPYSPTEISISVSGVTKRSDHVA
jgi:hypothetical protein